MGHAEHRGLDVLRALAAGEQQLTDAQREVEHARDRRAGLVSGRRAGCSGAGRSPTGMRSIVRIRSGQGASLERLTSGMPSGGVKAGWDSCGEVPVPGRAKAEPRGSALGSSTPRGGVNSEPPACCSGSLGCATGSSFRRSDGDR